MSKQELREAIQTLNFEDSGESPHTVTSEGGLLSKQLLSYASQEQLIRDAEKASLNEDDKLTVEEMHLLFASRRTKLGDENSVLSQEDVDKIMDISLSTLNFEAYSEYVRLSGELSPKNFAEKFPEILDKFMYYSKIKYVEHRSHESVRSMLEVNNDLRTGIWYLCGSEFSLESSSLKTVADFLESTDRNLSHFATEALFNLIRLDYRNKKAGETFLDLYSVAKNSLVTKLISDDPEEKDIGRGLVDAFWAEAPYEDLYEALLSCVVKAKSPENIQYSFKCIANRLSLEQCTKALVEDLSADLLTQERYEFVLSALGFGRSVYSDMSTFYKEIMDDFENYKPNLELQAFEESLLASLEGTILDIGFGSGRHLSSLVDKGRQVFGLDIVSDFAHRVKDQKPGANINIASWHNMPFKGESFDNIYCLGRSILHNQSPEEYIELLKETYRLLKKDGSFYLDLPSFFSDHYVQEREKIDQLGFDYHEEGFIVDSPDGAHYSMRFLPTEDQFKALARICGFDAVQIKDKPFKTHEGGENVNVYWELKKVGTDNLPNEELLELLSKIRTSSPRLYFSYF